MVKLVRDIWGNLVPSPKTKPLFRKGDILIFPVNIDKTPVTIKKVSTDAVGSEWYYFIYNQYMPEHRLIQSGVTRVFTGR